MCHHTLSLRVVEALARLCVCAGLTKHLLVSFATSYNNLSSAPYYKAEYLVFIVRYYI